MDAPYRIRTASVADAERLAVLERAVFSDPWSRDGLAELLAAPHVTARVAEARDGIIGYAISRSIGTTAELLNLAVEPRHRRRGLGQALLDDMLGALRARGITEVFLEVRVSNQPARQLYERAGFRPAGMRRAYYRRPLEDALVLRRDLSGGA
jgi:ribosomal-protein-alanine N-acetyltransferase